MVSSSKQKQLLISKEEDKCPKVAYRKWTVNEDRALIAALSGLCSLGYQRENGTFKNGYTYSLEKELTSRLPGSDLKASPHIESRLKLLKRQYEAIVDMKDANGMQWNKKEHTVTCWDDNVWDGWVKNHPFAKGLRNKPFPYYEDLRFIFGNRNKHKGSQKTPRSEVHHRRMIAKMLETERINRKRRLILDHGQGCENEVADKDSDGKAKNHHLVSLTSADRPDENDSYETKRNILATPDLHCSTDIILERANEETENLVGGGNSNDLNLTTTAVKTSNGNGNSMSSDLEEVTKIFESFLKKHREISFSSLVRMLGREEASSDKVSSTEKRALLNGELRRLPNLDLHARLRAATLIVGDTAKLDLFYSLPEDEREEWISMLLSGLI